MNLIKIAENVYVEPSEVSSVEREIVKKWQSSSPSDGRYVETFNGSRVILKCGRKVYVDGVMPDEIIRCLKPAPDKEVSE